MVTNPKVQEHAKKGGGIQRSNFKRGNEKVELMTSPPTKGSRVGAATMSPIWIPCIKFPAKKVIPEDARALDNTKHVSVILDWAVLPEYYDIISQLSKEEKLLRKKLVKYQVSSGKVCVALLQLFD